VLAEADEHESVRQVQVGPRKAQIKLLIDKEFKPIKFIKQNTGCQSVPYTLHCNTISPEYLNPNP